MERGFWNLLAIYVCILLFLSVCLSTFSPLEYLLGGLCDHLVTFSFSYCVPNATLHYHGTVINGFKLFPLLCCFLSLISFSHSYFLSFGSCRFFVSLYVIFFVFLLVIVHIYRAVFLPSSVFFFFLSPCFVKTALDEGSPELRSTTSSKPLVAVATQQRPIRTDATWALFTLLRLHFKYSYFMQSMEGTRRELRNGFVSGSLPTAPWQYRDDYKGFARRNLSTVLVETRPPLPRTGDIELFLIPLKRQAFKHRDILSMRSWVYKTKINELSFK
jgi:hypothetical protein